LFVFIIMKSFIVLTVLALAVFGATTQHTIYEFLTGDWDVMVYKTPFANAEIPEDLVSTRYTFTARNGTKEEEDKILDGVIVEEEGNKRFQVRLTGPYVGEYLLVKEAEEGAEEKKPAPVEDLGEDMGTKATEPTVEEKEEEEEEEQKEEEELELLSLFKFNLVNVTEGIFISQGAFGEDGAYQAVISATAKPSFTMTVYRLVDGKTAEYTTVIAKKILPRPQPTFMQKYGMLIMMGSMLLMNFFKTQNGVAGAGAGGDAAAAGAAPAAEAAAPAASASSE